MSKNNFKDKHRRNAGFDATSRMEEAERVRAALELSMERAEKARTERPRTPSVEVKVQVAAPSAPRKAETLVPLETLEEYFRLKKAEEQRKRVNNEAQLPTRHMRNYLKFARQQLRKAVDEADRLANEGHCPHDVFIDLERALAIVEDAADAFAVFRCELQEARHPETAKNHERQRAASGKEAQS